jgi:DNA topoisomerase-1
MSETMEPAPPGLVYVSDEEPGFRRRRAGRGFYYLDAGGRRLDTPDQLERIRRLAVPPAWTDVWICRSARGHLQATGRDARGRKQYRYHAEWRLFRDRVKFDRMLEFGLALPGIRRRVDADLKERGLSRDRVVALVVRLLETSLVRVGNEEYARDNGSYGLTTLRDRHARFNGQSLVLSFNGKSGREYKTTVSDARLARAVRRCQELPGQLLFQYIDDDNEVRPVRSEDVNDYLRETSGLDVTAKDYRTWVGTLLASAALANLPAPTSERRATTAVNQVIEAVSNELGNTPAVCRASYVHPDVIEEFRVGRLAQQWAKAATSSPRGLIPEERRLVGLLRGFERARARAARRAA